jgi:hypothetical protein
VPQQEWFNCQHVLPELAEAGEDCGAERLLPGNRAGLCSIAEKPVLHRWSKMFLVLMECGVTLAKVELCLDGSSKAA